MTDNKYFCFYNFGFNVDDKKEELGFWGMTDKFLGQTANGISKEDSITRSRTLDKPFHIEKDYRK